LFSRFFFPFLSVPHVLFLTTFFWPFVFFFSPLDCLRRISLFPRTETIFDPFSTGGLYQNLFLGAPTFFFFFSEGSPGFFFFFFFFKSDGKFLFCLFLPPFPSRRPYSLDPILPPFPPPTSRLVRGFLAPVLFRPTPPDPTNTRGAGNFPEFFFLF